MSESVHTVSNERKTDAGSHGNQLFFPLPTNPEDFAEKIHRFLDGGKRNLHVVADFDYTLTYPSCLGEHAAVSYSVLTSCLTGPSHERTEALKTFYMPILQNRTISSHEKAQHLETWKRATNQIIVDSRVSKQDLVRALASSSLVLRAGVYELVALCQAYEIPLTIVSAGAGDVIALALSSRCSLEGIDIRANFIEWDETGHASGFREPGVSCNKKASALAGEELRPNVLVLGDSCADVEAVAKCTFAEAMYLGFVTNSACLEEYKRHFDGLLEGESDLEFVNQLVKACT